MTDTNKTEQEMRSGLSDLTVKLAAETARAEQLGKNCMWLIEKIDRIHAAICHGENGTWQQRSDQAVHAAESIGMDGDDRRHVICLCPDCTKTKAANV